MVLRVTPILTAAKPVYWATFNPQPSRDGRRPAETFSLRHPKSAGQQRAHVEHIAANGFAFYADCNLLKFGWEEAYNPTSTKPPRRLPSPLTPCSEGHPPPPDGWDVLKAGQRNPDAKGGWKRLYHLPIVLTDGRAGAWEDTHFCSRIAVEDLMDKAASDPTDYGDALPFFRCVGTYDKRTGSGSTKVPLFVLEHWAKPDGSAIIQPTPSVYTAPVADEIPFEMPADAPTEITSEDDPRATGSRNGITEQLIVGGVTYPSAEAYRQSPAGKADAERDRRAEDERLERLREATSPDGNSHDAAKHAAEKLLERATAKAGGRRRVVSTPEGV